MDAPGVFSSGAPECPPCVVLLLGGGIEDALDLGDCRPDRQGGIADPEPGIGDAYRMPPHAGDRHSRFRVQVVAGEWDAGGGEALAGNPPDDLVTGGDALGVEQLPQRTHLVGVGGVDGGGDPDAESQRAGQRDAGAGAGEGTPAALAVMQVRCRRVERDLQRDQVRVQRLQRASAAAAQVHHAVGEDRDRCPRDDRVNDLGQFGVEKRFTTRDHDFGAPVGHELGHRSPNEVDRNAASRCSGRGLRAAVGAGQIAVEVAVEPQPAAQGWRLRLELDRPLTDLKRSDQRVAGQHAPGRQILGHRRRPQQAGWLPRSCQHQHAHVSPTSRPAPTRPIAVTARPVATITLAGKARRIMSMEGRLSAGNVRIRAPTGPAPTPAASRPWMMGISPAVGITNSVPTTANSTTATSPHAAKAPPTGNSQPRRPPSSSTTTRYSGSNLIDNRPNAVTNRRQATSTLDTSSTAHAAVSSGCTAGSVTVRPAPAKRPTSSVTPNTRTRPVTRRTVRNCHGNTKAMKTSAAGLSTGLPSQYASAVLTGTPRRRIPIATGAAQQVHIIDGRDSRPPLTVPATGPASARNSANSRRAGRNASTDAAISSPATSAGQIARPYALAYSFAARHDGGGGAPAVPVRIDVPSVWLPATAGILCQYGYHFAQVSATAVTVAKPSVPHSVARRETGTASFDTVMHPPRAYQSATTPTGPSRAARPRPCGNAASFPPVPRSAPPSVPPPVAASEPFLTVTWCVGSIPGPAARSRGRATTPRSNRRRRTGRYAGRSAAPEPPPRPGTPSR